MIEINDRLNNRHKSDDTFHYVEREREILITHAGLLTALVRAHRHTIRACATD